MCQQYCLSAVDVNRSSGLVAIAVLAQRSANDGRAAVAFDIHLGTFDPAAAA
jgi:hypothetical protein